MHYIIFNPRVSHDTWTCAFIMGWKRFSFTVFFSRWSVQRAPTGRNLFTSSSSLADSWEESRRKLLSWSFRTRSDIPLSSAVIPSPYYHKAGSARSLWRRKNILTIWKTRKYVVVSIFFFFFLSVGDVCWYLWNLNLLFRQMWELESRSSVSDSRANSFTRQDIEGPLQPCRLLFGHL